MKGRPEQKRLRVVNNDERWEPKERCMATIVHLGKKYGCVYGKGHDAPSDFGCDDHGASVRDEKYGHVTHCLMWRTGETIPRVHPDDYWNPETAARVRAEGCRVAEVHYV